MSAFRSSLLLAALGVLGLSIAAFFGALTQPFEILSNFRFQLAVAGLIITIALLLTGSRLRALVPALAMLINIAVMAQDVLTTLPDGPPEAAAGQRTVTMVFANVYRHQAALDAVAKLAAKENAEVVALTELPPGGVAAIRKALPNHPCVTAPIGRQTAMTTVIAAKQCSGQGQSTARRPSDAVFVDIPGVRVAAMHARAPWDNRATRERDEVIAASAALKAAEGPTVLLGDFNATAYSPGLTVVGEAGFRRGRCGAPFAATWRDASPLFGLAIDHAFLRGPVTLARCVVGPPIPADHFPLIVTVHVPAAG